MIYQCVEVSLHICDLSQALRRQSCGVAYKTAKAAPQHAPSAHAASNQPVRDEADRVHVAFSKELRGQRGLYGRWIWL